MVKHAVYHPDWTDPRAAGLHPRPGPRAGRPAARRRRPRLDLDAAAGLARAVGRRPGGRGAALPRRAGRRPRRRWPGETGRAVRVGFEPEPGCVVETTDAGGRRAVRRGHRPARRLPRPGPPGLRLGGARPTALAALRAAGLPVVKVQVSAALEAADPVAAPPTALRGVRRAALPAPDPVGAAAPPPTTSTRPWTRGLPGPVAGALPRAAARASPCRRCAPPRRCCAPRCASCSAATPPTCDHLDVETYTWNVLPPEQRPGDGGRAGRGHRRRAGVRPRRAVAWRSARGADDAARRARRRRPDAAPARPHAAPAGARATRASGAARTPCCRRSPARCRPRFLTGEPPAGTASSATAGTSATSARCCSGGSTTRWSAARSSGRRPAARGPATRWPTSAGGTRWARTSTGPSRPRPIYHADGRKEPDCYTDPPELHDELTDALGTFPLFTYWGPGAGHRLVARGSPRPPSTSWPTTQPDLTLVYVPHLDYDLQRFGPDAPQAAAAAAELDAVLGPLLDAAAARGAHRGGAVRVRHHRRRPAGRRQPGAARRGPAAGATPRTAWSTSTRGRRGRSPSPTTRSPTSTSRDPADVAAGGEALRRRCPAWPRCSTTPARPRTASTTRAPASWCWSPSRTPGSPTTTGSTTRARRTSRGSSRSTASPATTRPSCSSTRPAPGAAKRRAGVALARKKLGMRYLMSVVGLDAGARAVRGSHGRLPADPADGPVLLCSDPAATRRDRFAATEVKDLLLRLAGIEDAPHDRRPATDRRRRAARPLRRRAERASWTARTRTGRTARRAACSPRLHRFVLAGGKRLRPLFCYWGWRAAGGQPTARRSSWRRRRWSCSTRSRSSTTTSWTAATGGAASRRCTGSSPTCTRGRRGAATRPRTAATPPCSAATCAPPGRTRCSTSAACPPAQVHRGYGVFAVMRTEVIAGQYLDLVAGVGRRLGGQRADGRSG